MYSKQQEVNYVYLNKDDDNPDNNMDKAKICGNQEEPLMKDTKRCNLQENVWMIKDNENENRDYNTYKSEINKTQQRQLVKKIKCSDIKDKNDKRNNEQELLKNLICDDFEKILSNKVITNEESEFVYFNADKNSKYNNQHRKSRKEIECIGSQKNSVKFSKDTRTKNPVCNEEKFNKYNKQQPMTSKQATSGNISETQQRQLVKKIKCSDIKDKNDKRNNEQELLKNLICDDFEKILSNKVITNKESEFVYFNADKNSKYNNQHRKSRKEIECIGSQKNSVKFSKDTRTKNPVCNEEKFNKYNKQQPMTSKQATSGNISERFQHLKQRKRIICAKLATKRQRLQMQHQINVKGNNNCNIKSNRDRECKAVGVNKTDFPNTKQETQDQKSFNSLRAMTSELQKTDPGNYIGVLNSKLVNKLFQNVVTKDLDNQRNNYKKEQDSEKNNSFNKFPILPDLSSSKKKKKKKKKRGNVNCPTSEKQFTSYVNSILREFFGKYQQKELQKYYNLPRMVRDWEVFANDLVKQGYGCIVDKEIRINAKQFSQAFITMSTDREANENDAIITSSIGRRHALDGDIVRAFVLNENLPSNINNTKISHIMEEKTSLSLDTDDGEDDLAEESEIDDTLNVEVKPTEKNCRKAFIIKIIKQTQHREIVGCINFMDITSIDLKGKFHKLIPHNKRMPTVYISEEQFGEDVKKLKFSVLRESLYVARVLEIDSNGYCFGEIVQELGKVGNMEAEIKAILLHNGLKDIKPYEQKFNDMYKPQMPPISKQDLSNREDLRNKCIFTIDPLTAKDLDDAVSVEKLNNSEFEIGVHISDVSFYLEENSELDNLVKHRATSIYLVNKVIHMLPTTLCSRCSLLPGEDKFAFSVFWTWHNGKQEITKTRFTRSIINSCAQFSYEQAQNIIDFRYMELDGDDIPNLYNGYKPKDIKWRVLFLHDLAQIFKAKRFDNGALSINNPKLSFNLDPNTGEPASYAFEERCEANYLIEEFMLLANQSVAKFIYRHFPDKSILRNHPPPLKKSLKALKDRLNSLGIDLDIRSSKSISESIQNLIDNADDSNAMYSCLSILLVKPMARARYYCSKGYSVGDFWHYALSLPIYTHFTSPIRRYPDIMVHRLLAAALNYCSPPERTTEELQHLATICNDQKSNARNAGDESTDLFFKRYLKANGPITVKAAVIEIGERVMNVISLDTGHTILIKYGDQKCAINRSNAPKVITISETNKPTARTTTLKLFSIVNVKIILQNKQLVGFLAIGSIDEELITSVRSSEEYLEIDSSTNIASDESLSALQQKKNNRM